MARPGGTASIRRLFLAPFGTDATERLVAAALKLVPGPDYRGILYLAPSPRKLRDTELRFARLCGRDGFIPPEFLTPGQFARRLYEVHGQARPLPAELRPLLVQRLLPAETRRRTLGYAQAVAEFIADIKTWVRPEDRPGLRARFEEELAGFEKPLARALEALEVLDRYDAELKARGRVDSEDLLGAAPALAALRPPRLLILDGFAAPEPPEAALLAALVEAAGTVLVAAHAAPPEQEADEDYAFAGRFVRFITGLGGFKTTRLPSPTLPAPEGLFVFPDPEAEIAGICRHLRGRTNLADTVVALPDIGARAPMVRRVFRRYRLPATLYPETRLDASPPVVAVLDLLEAVAHDFERMPFAAALSSPWLAGLLQLPADTDDTGRDRAADAVNNLSRRAGIIKGRNNWRRLATRLAAAESRLSVEDAELARDLETRIRRAIGLAIKMLESADNFGRQAARLKAFLEAVKFGSSLDPDAPGISPLLEDRSAFYDALDSLVEFETEFGAEPGPRAAFIRALEYLVGLCGRAADPPPAGVLVVGLAETTGLHPSHVVVGGLTESNLPGRRSADPILPERLRRALGMPDLDHHRDWQRYNLRRTIESGADASFLCFHDSDGDKPVLPTPLLEIPTRAFPAPAALFSEAEEQFADGSRAGRPFADRDNTVNFSADPRARAALARRYGPDRPFSVTGLEFYRACPYRYYVERVLGLESTDEPQYAIDARQWGSVIHDALSRLYADGPVEMPKLEPAARRALDAALKGADLPRFWAETARRVFTNILPRFLTIEQALRDAGWRPERVELSLSGPVAENLTVRGRVDRVDSGPGGQIILDYKTGEKTVHPREVLEERTHLQLPLYTRLLEAETGRPVANAAIYSLRRDRPGWLADDRLQLAELVEAAVKTAVETAAAIRVGRFPAEPAGSACQYCDLDWLCGPEGSE
ncbi:MAG: PD-(D/E)XK nuclease family protein [bacterium]